MPTRPKKRCPAAAEPVGAEDVERARLGVLGLPVLPPLAVGRVVVHADGPARSLVAPPEEHVRRRRREHDVALARLDTGDRRVEVGGVDERRRRLDEDRDRRRCGLRSDRRPRLETRRRVQHMQRVQQRRLARRLASRELLGTIDDLRSRAAGGFGDRGVVGRDDDPADPLRGERRAHRAGHERHAAHPREVLARQALRPAPRRDDRGRDGGRGIRPPGGVRGVAGDRARRTHGSRRFGEVDLGHGAKLRAPSSRPVHTR